jgi:hypothetical protein
MSMNFLAAKGSLKPQTDVSNIAQDWAKMIAQGNNQETPKNPMRETVNDLINSTLLKEVEMPRFTTIQDIFNADKGNKLNTFGEYLTNNPDATRLLGSFLGGTYLDTMRNRFVNSGEREALEQEAQMQKAQENALNEERAKQKLAGDMYSAFQQMDIADMNDRRARELAEQQEKWSREKFNEEMKLKREEMGMRRAEKEADRAMRRELANIIHGGSSRGGGVATGGASGVPNLNNVKMTAAERKALTENKTTLANIDAGLKALDKNRDAYTLWKGLLGSDITNRIDPKGVATRTQIDNITAVYRKWLTGAQMSDKERKAYERFLPAPTDNYTIVKSKLEGMKGAVQRSNDAILSNYGISSSGNADPLGLGL